MPSAYQGHGPTDDVAVIGAGMVGLSTAWFLQEIDAGVTVYERDHVGAGASWGNAGWLTPALTAPLPEPSVLRYGLRAVLSPRAPVYPPPRADSDLARFLAGYVRRCAGRQWRRGMATYVPVNARALDAFDALAAGNVTARTQPTGAFLACFGRERDARRLVAELGQLAVAGQQLDYVPISGRRARAMERALTDRVAAAVEIRGQRFRHPPEFVRSLAEAVRSRGCRSDRPPPEGARALRCRWARRRAQWRRPSPRWRVRHPAIA
ncbi:FAD dependent oxidoreductase [Micromonospora coriariae]|uniref:FAD dependent oxidoreductase n=1 Tax=Micromonospora coriariae TaxID=285665 RepID=A0A1C4U658_9ACTN|nr:FAD-dependent oxidoreductase [Micromonospora coriariae]SCE67099.1 FAD dependent oxidoreductase [Micromonospora coriariae]